MESSWWEQVTAVGLGLFGAWLTVSLPLVVSIAVVLLPGRAVADKRLFVAVSTVSAYGIFGCALALVSPVFFLESIFGQNPGYERSTAWNILVKLPITLGILVGLGLPMFLRWSRLGIRSPFYSLEPATDDSSTYVGVRTSKPDQES